jgi:hypothetical protein
VLVRGYGGYNTRWALFLLTHIFPLVSKDIFFFFLFSFFFFLFSFFFFVLWDLFIYLIYWCLYWQNSTKPPAATTIFFGANDAALLGRNSERQHVPVEEYKENLKKMVLHLKVFFLSYIIIIIIIIILEFFCWFYILVGNNQY